MSRAAWTWARVLAPAAIFTVLVWRLGTSPFVHGVRAVDGRALTAAAGLALVTTVCCAWRWKIVAAGFGVELSLGAAVAAYYRSLFLNVTLPGGIVGDVHRGVSHGRDVDDVGRALGAVVCERFAGQVVQAVLTVGVLLALPSPAHAVMPFVAIGVAAALVVVGVAALRDGRLALRAWAAVALASALVVGGHVVTFLIAAQTAGVTAPVSRMVPLALLVMLVMALPSIGGWGPREGATAWAFGAAGLGAQHGVATAVAYGVMVLVSTLPGAVVLVVAFWRRRRAPELAPEPPLANQPAHA